GGTSATPFRKSGSQPEGFQKPSLRPSRHDRSADLEPHRPGAARRRRPDRRRHRVEPPRLSRPRRSHRRRGRLVPGRGRERAARRLRRQKVFRRAASDSVSASLPTAKRRRLEDPVHDRLVTNRNRRRPTWKGATLAFVLLATVAFAFSALTGLAW